MEKPASFNWVAETPASRNGLNTPRRPFATPATPPTRRARWPSSAPVTLWALAGEGEIANLAVHPRFQGQGVGRALMQTALSQADELGLERILLESARQQRTRPAAVPIRSASWRMAAAAPTTPTAKTPSLMSIHRQPANRPTRTTAQTG